MPEKKFVDHTKGFGHDRSKPASELASVFPQNPKAGLTHKEPMKRRRLHLIGEPNQLYTLEEARLIIAEERKFRLPSTYKRRVRDDRANVINRRAPIMCISGLMWRSWI